MNEQQNFQAIEEFWKIATLLSLICLEPLVKGLKHEQDQHLNETTQQWHLFLNIFSSLGDVDKAGKTVTATVGAVHRSDRILFVAANNGVKEDVKEHLQEVLNKLQSLNKADPETQKATQQYIFKNSVTHSNDKIQNYLWWLKTSIESLACEEVNVANELDSDLLEVLRNLVKLEDDHTGLCKAAYAFRKTQYYKPLNEKRQMVHGSKRWLWLRVHHLIGRLGSWYPSSRKLVQIAVQYPSLLRDLNLRFLSRSNLESFTKLRAFVKNAPKPDEETFASLIGNLFPHSPYEDVVETLEYMRSKDRDVAEVSIENDLVRADSVKDAPVASSFLQRLREIRKSLPMHAEILPVDYMYQQGYSYINDDRYVGCSKPSCYSCHFYLRHHPSRMLPRACHGTIYYRWCPGRHAMQLYNGKTCIQIMTESMREEILTRVMHKCRAGKRLPDSVTGMTRSSRN